jgi:hypothetical protein
MLLKYHPRGGGGGIQQSIKYITHVNEYIMKLLDEDELLMN